MNVNIILSFLTNFRPANFSYLNNIDFLKIRKNSKIILRNFFLFLILLKYLTNNKNKKFLNQTVWVKPTKKKLITILKAPYKNKLARNQLLLKRFFIFYKIKLIFLDKIDFKSFDKILELIKFFKNFNFFLESSLIYQYKTKINFNFFYNNFFIIN